MADENVVNLFTNGNQETSPSIGNELLYFTAESDLLNVSNDSVNQCLLKTQNENINRSTLSNDSFTFDEKSGDSNRNPVENFDLSITEAFAKMAVNDVTMKTVSCIESLDNKSDEILKNELLHQPDNAETSAKIIFDNSVNDVTMKSVSCSSEPLDKSDEILKSELLQQPAITEASAKMIFNNSVNDVIMKSLSCSSEPLDDKLDEILKDELVQMASKPMIGEPLSFFQVESPKLNISTHIEKGEEPSQKNDLLPEIEENFSPAQVNEVNQAIQKTDEEICKGDATPLTDGIRQSIEESHDLKTQMESPHGSSAVEEKLASPNSSGCLLSEQALSFMAGGDSSNELSNSMPDDSKLSLNVSNPESSVPLKQDVGKHPVSDIGLSPQGTNVTSNIVSTNDDSVFKVPAIPVKAVEPQAVSPVKALSNNSVGETLPVTSLKEISGFQTSAEVPPGNLPLGPSEPVNDRKGLFGTLEPCKLTGTEVASSGLPEPRVFTDFEEERNGFEDNPFKVPEPPKDEEEEEFTDAVQFFKDPSSFQYLENIQTSLPTDSVPRSSLYVAFDPLHSKRVSVSQMQSTLLGQLIPESQVPNNNSTPVKKHLVDASLRESLGVLISFDSPKPSAKVVPEENEPPVPATVAKQYSEEELQQILKIHELTMQETYLKKHRELEQEMAKAEEKNRDTIEKLSSLVLLFRNSMEEITGVIKPLKMRNEELESKADELEKENEKLKEDLKTAGEDLHSVESTFSDFHKRYEQCKGMLKTYKENEEQLKAKLSEQEQNYNTLQEQSHEALEKANMEAMVAKKSSEGQVTVLKAQLKKAELKISSLESDLSQVKIENSKLGGICDDLMAKVSEG